MNDFIVLVSKIEPYWATSEPQLAQIPEFDRIFKCLQSRLDISVAFDRLRFDSVSWLMAVTKLETETASSDRFCYDYVTTLSTLFLYDLP